MIRTALLQLNSSDDPAANLSTASEMVSEAVRDGAEFVLTPEVTNCVSASRTRQEEVLRHESDDPSLAGLREGAARHGIWLLIGSLALKTGDADGRFANRSFLVAPDGEIAARYDKMHMFDVQVSETEAYHESKGYRPGNRAVLAQTPFASIGMSICYDIRFPQLYRRLAQAGADILTVPSAFSPVTGAAHWESLLRARAIETGAFVLAPAQTGTHAATRGKSRTTFGHSMVISPWGEVLADQGGAPGIVSVELDMALVAQSRQRIPSLRHDQTFTGPD